MPSFKIIEALGSGKKDIKVFPKYGRGSHLGHVVGHAVSEKKLS